MKNQVLFHMQSSKSVMLIEEPTHMIQSITKTTTIQFQCNQPVENYRFPCFLHSKETKQCTYCNGLGYLTPDSRFSKFVSAILDFKLGSSKADKYPESSRKIQSQNTQSTAQPSSKSYHNIFRSTIVQASKSQHRKSLAPSSSYHNGIECNQCHQQPILGKRFVCNICDDYDLCEDCYRKQAHQHKSFEVMLQSKSQISKARLKKYVEKEEEMARVKLSKFKVWRG